MARKPKKPSLDVRIKTDAKLRARVLKNPGLRSKLSDASLRKYAPQQAKTRALSKRLATPIAPGSAITERDLAHEAQAAQTVRYGPQQRELATQLGVAQQTERDTGSFYDEYRAALAQHASNVAAYQQGAQAALAQTQAGVTGLAQPAPAGSPADMQADASNAAAIRQALAGSFGSQQALTGAAANTYAGAQANVIAPAQKLSALAQARGRTRDVRGDIEALQREAGAFNQQFRQERRGEEFKNQLAMQTLAGNQANMAADNAVAAANAASNAAARSPEGKAAATTAQEEAKNAAKLGISVHQYRMLGPNERGRRLKALKGTTKGSASDTRYTSGPFAGMLKSEVNALSDSEAKRKVADYQKNGGGKPKTVEPGTAARRSFRQKYGVDLQPTSAHNAARDQVTRATQAFGRRTDKDGNPVTTQQIADALVAGSVKGVGKISPVLVRAALEIKRNGAITPGTANRLHRAGYSVSALGFKTKAAPRPKPRTPRRRSGTQGAIPGFGSTGSRRS